jgi:uncharacterized protein YbcI
MASQISEIGGAVSVPCCDLEDRFEGCQNQRTATLPAPSSRLVCDQPRDTATTNEVAARSRGELEAAICREINRFERDYMGRGPGHIRAHLIGDLLIVRLKGVLTAAEKQLVKTQLPERGRELLKQVRMAIIDTTRPVIDPIVEKITGVKVLSLHHDINVAGDEFILFTLADAPDLRGTLKR